MSHLLNGFLMVPRGLWQYLTRPWAPADLEAVGFAFGVVVCGLVFAIVLVTVLGKLAGR